MCQRCNEALMAGATAANLLADAAKKLYSINASKESAILAEAAADLFKPVEAAVPGAQGKSEGSVGDAASQPFSVAEALTRINGTLPKGMEIREDGLLYMDGVAIGEAQIVRRPTRH